MGRKFSAPSPPARLCPRKANAISKIAKYEVDLGRTCRRWRVAQQAERKALAAIPDSQVDRSYIPPLSSH